jgi:hypothetical protein
LTHIQSAILLHLLFLYSNWTHAPSSRVQVALHNDSLDSGDHAVVAGRHLDGRHLSVRERNSLALGGDEDDLFVELDALFEDPES